VERDLQLKASYIYIYMYIYICKVTARFTKETYNLKESTNRSHLIVVGVVAS